MTIQELHNYIDRTLGNNVRCLLSSFWWKKLFHLVVDKVESVENALSNKQTILKSGSNIKTINGKSILGSGDIEIEGGGDVSTLATKEELTALQNSVIENEEATELAFNKVREDLVAYYYNKEQINNEITKVENKIIDNEEVTAAAINDLKAIIRDLQNQVKALKNAQ
jgi:hypothetical protein